MGGSRSQIAGIVSRLKISGDLPKIQVAARRKPSSERARRTQIKAVLKEDGAAISSLFTPMPSLKKTRATVMEIGPRQCRYPVESKGSDHLFCGELDTGDSCYCALHKSVCIVPAKIAVKRTGIRKNR